MSTADDDGGIPTLRHVIVPGQKAARGQPRRAPRRASDPRQTVPEHLQPDEAPLQAELPAVDAEPVAPAPVEHFEENPAAVADTPAEATLYGSVLDELAPGSDIGGRLDRILDKYTQLLREELRAEIEEIVREQRARNGH